MADINNRLTQHTNSADDLKNRLLKRKESGEPGRLFRCAERLVLRTVCPSQRQISEI